MYFFCDFRRLSQFYRKFNQANNKFGWAAWPYESPFSQLSNVLLRGYFDWLIDWLIDGQMNEWMAGRLID